MITAIPDLSIPKRQTPLLTLAWLKDRSPKDDARTIVDGMMEQAYGPYGNMVIVGGDADLAWGLLVPEKPAPLTCWSVHTEGSELCLIEGDLYDNPANLKILPGNNPLLAKYTVEQLRRYPDEPLPLNGVYCGIYVSHGRSCAYVFGDITGTRQIFWHSDQRQFIVSGSLWSFRGHPSLKKEWDRMALMEAMTLGFPLDGRTWLHGVRQVQPGRQVRSPMRGDAEIRRLTKPISRTETTLRRSVENLRESLDNALISICSKLNGQAGLALSGGLDSRILLASLHANQLHHENFTSCLNPDEADHKVASSCAKLIGEQTHTVLLRSDLVGALHRDIRLINEGESPGFGFFLLAGQTQAQTDNLMFGYPADLFAGVPLGPFQPLSFKTKREVGEALLKAFMTNFSPHEAGDLVSDSFRADWQDVLCEWFDSFERIEQQSMLDVYMDHALDHRVQRRARLRIDSSRWFCLPIYPYMDTRVYTAYRSLPLEHLRGERAHLALLASYQTGLENLPSAVRSFFNLPIAEEYRYRHMVHAGRIVRQKWLVPLQQKWQECKGSLGMGQSSLNPLRETELQKLRFHPMFDWRHVERLLDNARRGRFSNREALNHLISLAVVDEFLFGNGAPDRPPLRILNSNVITHNGPVAA